jgi:hypothetical protein
VGTLRNASILVALLAARASADSDIEKADKLFEQGIKLRDTNLEQSCEKFNESLKLNPQAIGTLMNVALCDEKLGHSASAHRLFSEALQRAKEGNLPDFIKEAQSHIDALAPELSKVTIHFATRLNGMKVLINNEVVPEEKLGGEFPVDPGELEVTVSAPGRISFETKIMIGKKEIKAIEVPELKKSVTVKNSKRTAGVVVTISGAGMLVGGVVIGLVARSRWKGAFEVSEGKPPCNKAELTCPPDRQSETDSARTLGNVGTGVGVIGVVGIGVGVYLWLTSSKDSNPTEKRLTFVPDVTPESAGFAAIGRF